MIERMLFGAGLVFNQTWEDPEVDRQALALTPDDVLLTIASAGDNVLALALSGPKKIYAVDLNPAQIHLLQLKIVAAQRLSHADFASLFSLAPCPHAPALYSVLRPHLDCQAREFWDAHLHLLPSGLYRSGLFGRALWLLRNCLRLLCGTRTLDQFFACATIGEQAEYYRTKIHARWWNSLAKPLAAQLPVLLLFGAHPRQAMRIRGQRFAEQLAGGIFHALTTFPARENFFWQQAFLGRYLVPPPHLQPEQFARLKEMAGRIEARVGRVEQLARELPPGSVTGFNLLDAPDWLSPEETIKWWMTFQRAAAPRSRILFRTIDPSYRLPDSILAYWQDETDPGWTAKERTGVYARVCVFRLREGERKNVL